MKHFILLFIICFTFGKLSAQVRAQAMPAEQKAEVKTAPQDQALSVYPNPSSGVVTISLDGYEGKRTDLRIMNVIGNTVYREIIPAPGARFAKSLDLSKLAKGLYYVKIETPTYSEVRKFILR